MSRTTNENLAVRRRAQVAGFLINKATYRQIAQQLGVSLGTVARDVDILVRQWSKEQNPEDKLRWVQTELQKLAAMEAAIASVALNPPSKDDLGNYKYRYTVFEQLNAVDRTLSIMDRRSRLLGLSPDDAVSLERSDRLIVITHESKKKDEQQETIALGDGIQT